VLWKGTGQPAGEPLSLGHDLGYGLATDGHRLYVGITGGRIRVFGR
jgi:hypothetical protein